MSRACYAVFLESLKMSMIDARGRGGHRKASKRYKENGGTESIIGGRLDVLRRLRAKAGCKMGSTISIEEAEMSLNLSKPILEDISRMP